MPCLLRGPWNQKGSPSKVLTGRGLKHTERSRVHQGTLSLAASFSGISILYSIESGAKDGSRTTTSTEPVHSSLPPGPPVKGLRPFFRTETLMSRFMAVGCPQKRAKLLVGNCHNCNDIFRKRRSRTHSDYLYRFWMLFEQISLSITFSCSPEALNATKKAVPPHIEIAARYLG